eukprot:CAMPEP_0201570756 /NCGR_PEP_ID=MMETSP0190_2-20130828/13129_1 /ASSEMBLY_ACC=CAM_ASM_000263 /TAXON_ID=37353 /ORGANISM="Rosalina sp." /LENGTH=207 /DNA_ID=CAMNT_0047994623 /DNA_START=100 /DNA_END=720 /DNA_ORIENTATION=-
MKATVQHPNSASPFLAIVSSYSGKLPEPDQSLIGTLVYHESDSLGCDPWPSSTKDKIKHNSGQLSIGIVDRGICPFLQKSKEAESIGLDLLLVVSEDDSMTPLGADEKELETYKQELNGKDIITTIMVPHSFKTFMESNDGQITITQYKSSPYDSGMLIMICISTFLVGLGAWYSSDAERAKMYSNGNRMGLRRRAPIQEIDHTMAW